LVTMAPQSGVNLCFQTLNLNIGEPAGASPPFFPTMS
jgi:hypothetical protein